MTETPTPAPDFSRMLPLRRLRQFLRAELRKTPSAVPVDTVVVAALERARREGYLVDAGEVREELLEMVRRTRWRP